MVICYNHKNISLILQYNQPDSVFRLMNRLLFLLFFSIFFIFEANSQRFLGALAFGGNLTQVDGDEVFGYKKIGFNAGAAAFLPIKEIFFVSLEVGFTQKGAYQKYPRVSVIGQGLPYYDLRLNYLEVPLLFHIEDKQFAMLGTGFSFNRLVGLREIEWGKETASGTSANIYSMNDINWIVDIRLRMYKSLRLNFRFAYSLDKIRTRTFTYQDGSSETRNQFNNILTLRLVYTFNETIRPRPDNGS